MPELMGKLDTSVNGPDGLPSFNGDAWDRVNWRHQEEQVRRRRGLFFKGVQEGVLASGGNQTKNSWRSVGNKLCNGREGRDATKSCRSQWIELAWRPRNPA